MLKNIYIEIFLVYPGKLFNMYIRKIYKIKLCKYLLNPYTHIYY